MSKVVISTTNFRRRRLTTVSGMSALPLDDSVSGLVDCTTGNTIAEPDPMEHQHRVLP